MGKNMNEQPLGKMPEWDLSALYSGIEAPEIATDIARAEQGAKTFHAAYNGQLAELANKGSGLGKAIAEFEKMADLMGKLGSYAGLLYAADTQDGTRAKFYGDIQEKLTLINTSLLFFPLELNRLDETRLEECYNSDEDLSRYRPWLDDLRKEKPHQLDDKLEELFNDKHVSSRAAWDRLFSETMTALRFEVGGEELALEAALNLLTDPDRSRRQQAGEAIAKVLGENRRLFTLITNTLAKDNEVNDRWRGFKGIADSRHLDNRVEPEVVDALEKTVSDAYPRLSHRYYALKAKWMGLEKLEYWDRNAPLPEDIARLISWSDARKIVLEAYRDFSPKMAAIAEDFFINNWIDAPLREGKSPGAFAHPTVPSAHPFVLLNYQGKPRDVMTLAHELGHGVHQFLANVQGPLMASTPLTLAETASVFGEMLTFRKLLSETATTQERKVMLAMKVEDMLNTVVRQIAFYRFERRLHTERRKGELTSEDIDAIWLDTQREALGPAINLREDYSCFWSYIPHFISTPFYVYAYAFGDCLVNSLYAIYQRGDEGFVDKYMDMLAAGGSRHHSEMLHPFGLDASDPEFWKQGLSMIEGMIDELEGLV
jgi:oligoendopeptidase F